MDGRFDLSGEVVSYGLRQPMHDSPVHDGRGR